jgi:hypothetical protein
MLKFPIGVLFTTADDVDHIRSVTAFLTSGKLHVAETIVLHGTKSWPLLDHRDKHATTAKCIFGLIVVHQAKAGKILDIASENERAPANYFKVKLQSMSKMFTVSFLFVFLLFSLTPNRNILGIATRTWGGSLRAYTATLLLSSLLLRMKAASSSCGTHSSFMVPLYVLLHPWAGCTLVVVQVKKSPST